MAITSLLIMNFRFQTQKTQTQKTQHGKCVAWCISLLLLALFLAVASPRPVFAQDAISVRAEVDSNELFVGESLNLQLVINGIISPTLPSMTDLVESFDVELMREQPISQSSTTIINGRVSQRSIVRLIAEYRLTPKRTGKLVIPRLEIVHEGETYRSQAITINVTHPEPQNYVLIETKASRDYVYPSQNFDVTLEILVREIPDREIDPLRVLARQPPQLVIPWIRTPEGLTDMDDDRWLNRLLSNRGYGFGINELSVSGAFLFDNPAMAVFDLLQGKVTRKNEEGVEESYYRYVITKRFRADRPGLSNFGPAIAKGTFAIGEDDGAFLGKRLAAIAPVKQVETREVPSPRPPNFIGGIGEYAMEASVSPNHCKVGDPITLSIVVSANPFNLELISAPNLSLVPEIRDGFEIIDPSPVGIIDGNIKRFSYSLRPNSTSSTIPSLDFQVFDPDSESFTGLSSEPVELTVDKGEQMDIVSFPNASPSLALNEKQGILLGDPASHPLWNESLATRYVVSFACAICGLSLLTQAGMFVLPRWRSYVNKRRAQNFDLVIDETLKTYQAHEGRGEREAAMRSLQRGFARLFVVGTGSIGAETCSSSAVRTTEEVVSLAIRAGASEPFVAELRVLLNGIDANRFSGIENAPSDVLAQATKLLRESANVLRNHRSSVSSKGSQSIGKAIPLVIIILSLIESAPSFAKEVEPIAATNNVSSDRVTHQNMDALVGAFKDSQSPEQYVLIASRVEEAVRRGERSGSHFFHLGNAWYLAGDFGRSIYAYQIAKRYLPGDATIEHNLNMAILKAHEGKEESSPPPVVSSWLINSLSHFAQVIICCGIFCLSAIFLLTGHIQQNRRWTGLSFCILLIASSCGIWVWYQSPDRYSATFGVVTRETIARTGMSRASEIALAQPLSTGTEIRVLHGTSQWTLVQTLSGEEAWIPSDHLIHGL